MPIPFNQFEKYINGTILKRGLSYFKKGHVYNFEEMNDGVYKAKVEGSENYTVQITIKNEILTEYSCNCPYDFGPICKHITAVLYYLKKENKILETEMEYTKTGKKSKQSKRKTVAQQIDELLEKATHIELREFIREKASEDSPFRNELLLAFAQHNANDSKELYAKQVASILKKAGGRYGYIDWYSSNKVGREVGAMLEKAQKHINNHNYKSAIYICTAIMEKMIGAVEHCDDSSGYLGDSIHNAYELLYSIALNERPEEIRKLIFDYCMTSFDSRVYYGWDWHFGVLELANLLLKTDEDVEQICKRLDKLNSSEFEKNRAQTLNYNVLLKFKGEKAAEEYLEQNIANPKLRGMAIEKAFEAKNFETAIALANDGINYDLKERPGFAKDWYEWLLKIAHAQNNTEKIIEYAHILFVSRRWSEQEYYQILKNYVKQEEWAEYVETLIQEITSQQNVFDTSVVAYIYIQEEFWDRLLEIVNKTPDFSTIDRYVQYLYKVYPTEIVELYTNCILDYLGHSMTRDHYQYACQYISKIMNLGAKENAYEIINFLRKEYPRKRALLEEINKVLIVKR